MAAPAEITAILRSYAKPIRPVTAATAVPAYGEAGVGSPALVAATGVPWRPFLLGLLVGGTIVSLRQWR